MDLLSVGLVSCSWVLLLVAEPSCWHVEPYRQYPALLPIVLNALRGEQKWGVRREVYRVLGTVGALNPEEFKVVEKKASEQDPSLLENARGKDNEAVNQKVGDKGEVLFPSNMATPDEYYPTVAINALIK